MLKNHVLGPQAAVPRINIAVARLSAGGAGETRSKESSPDVMLRVLCLPMPLGENLVRKFPGTKPSSGVSATSVPRSLLSY